MYLYGVETCDPPPPEKKKHFAVAANYSKHANYFPPFILLGLTWSVDRS